MIEGFKGSLKILTQKNRTECPDLFMEYIFLFIYFVYSLDDEAINDALMMRVRMRLDLTSPNV
jgi:hypothetical protein